MSTFISPSSSPISIHVPREGHDLTESCTRLPLISISIHVPREGHDLRRQCTRGVGRRISIHVPREGHDLLQRPRRQSGRNFNPRAPRGARPSAALYPFLAGDISIHVPREGHDQSIAILRIVLQVFQSTCPARGTTLNLGGRKPSFFYFNPRAPRGARPNEGQLPHAAM